MLIGESSIKIEDSEEDRRTGFVDQLLSADTSSSTAFVEVANDSDSDLVETNVQESDNMKIADVAANDRSMSSHFTLVHCKEYVVTMLLIAKPVSIIDFSKWILIHRLASSFCHHLVGGS